MTDMEFTLLSDTTFKFLSDISHVSKIIIDKKEVSNYILNVQRRDDKEIIRAREYLCNQGFIGRISNESDAIKLFIQKEDYFKSSCDYMREEQILISFNSDPEAYFSKICDLVEKMSSFEHEQKCLIDDSGSYDDYLEHKSLIGDKVLKKD